MKEQQNHTHFSRYLAGFKWGVMFRQLLLTVPQYSNIVPTAPVEEATSDTWIRFDVKQICINMKGNHPLST